MPALADLGRRAASALILIPLALAMVWLGGGAFRAFIVAVGIGLTWEWIGLCRHSTRTLPGAAMLGAGGMLIWVALYAFNWLRVDPIVGRANILFLLGVVWSTDIGAYLTGRAIGGPKLAPRVSPGKTWAGSIGGLIGAAGAGLAAAATGGVALDEAAAIAAGFSIVAQAGDLLESFVKRRFGVKDSGNLIPGHGGLLDRLDSTLAVTLAAALLVMIRGRGVVLWG